MSSATERRRWYVSIMSLAVCVPKVIHDADQIRGAILHQKYEMPKHVEADAKRPPFARRYFQMDFHEGKCLNFDSDFTEVCFLGFNWQ